MFVVMPGGGNGGGMSRKAWLALLVCVPAYAGIIAFILYVTRFNIDLLFHTWWGFLILMATFFGYLLACILTVGRFASPRSMSHTPDPSAE